MKTETELLNAIETTPKDGALLSEYALWLAENGQEGEATRITDHLFQEPDGTIEGMKGHARSVATVRQNSYVLRPPRTDCIAQGRGSPAEAHERRLAVQKARFCLIRSPAQPRHPALARRACSPFRGLAPCGGLVRVGAS